VGEGRLAPIDEDRRQFPYSSLLYQKAHRGAPLPYPDEDPSLIAPSLGLASVLQKQYPGLAPFLGQTSTSQAAPQVPGQQSEYYSPNAQDNPTPGRHHVQFMEAQPNADLLKGELLSHAMTQRDSGGLPVNNTVSGAMDRLQALRTPRQMLTDWRAQQQDKAQWGDQVPTDYQAYLQQVRMPAYLRAASDGSWGRYLTPDQKAVGGDVNDYLRRASPAGLFPDTP
jgi:hypothetical protein